VIITRGAPVNRRTFIQTTIGSIVAGSGFAAACSRRATPPLSDAPEGGVAFALEEATIAGLQAALTAGRYSVGALTDLYLKRIEETNRNGPMLQAVIEINSDARRIADQLDVERRSPRRRGALHGIPILVKDNVDTADRMLTTAGSPALAGSRPGRDAFVIERLRAAGAVILGKTNLIEFAGFKGMPQFSWSSRGGLCRNPYALDRSALGSSCGSAVAVSANLAAVGIGTETNGSILAPSAFAGVVGIKPTVGLVGRSGIVPIASSFDTAGPIARTVTDAALLLAAVAGTDPRDAATSGAHALDDPPALDAEALNGARIGVARSFFGDDPRVVQILDRTIDVIVFIERIGSSGRARVGNSADARLKASRYVELN
jgi:amidase